MVKSFSEAVNLVEARAEQRGVRADLVDLKKEIRSTAVSQARNILGVTPGMEVAWHREDGHLVKGHAKTDQELGLASEKPAALREAAARWRK